MGSVIPPSNAGSKEDSARPLVSFLRERKNTPKATPALANVAAAIIGRSVS